MINDIIEWFNANPVIKQTVIITGILLLSIISYFITKKIILKGIGILVKKSKTRLDDIIFDKVMSQRLAYIIPILIIYNFAYLTPSLAIAIQRIALALIFLTIITAFIGFLNAINTIYEHKKQFKERPIKGYIQAVSIILYVVGGLIMVGILTGQSLWVLLSGVGAVTAVILLIFRDTILSFVASLQITTNDLVRINDWIEVPKYGADGDVIDIALHTIKVQNWDKTVTVIPTHKLIEQSFKNWRGMQESGGRRIKRAIHIDISTIKFCDEHMLERLGKIRLLKKYLDEKKREIDEDNKVKNIDTTGSQVNGRRLTNIGTFRAYIEAYLKNHDKIEQGMTFLVRQLPPGPTGLPIEIYVFSNDTEWASYEALQADIFDHLFAVVKEFELSVFQYPGGKDLQKIKQ
jgi:miniconductance mechanosensitive channel